MQNNEIKPTLDRGQYFKNIITNHNNKTGFDFQLDELDKDENYKYAHATHAEAAYTITCQMDTDCDHMYALYFKPTGFSTSCTMPDNMTKENLDKLIRGDAYKIRFESMNLLDSLRGRLQNEMSTLQEGIFNELISDREIQNTYDTIIEAARKLLQDKLIA